MKTRVREQSEDQSEGPEKRTRVKTRVRDQTEDQRTRVRDESER